MLDILLSERVQQAFLSGWGMTLKISALSSVLAMGIGFLMAFCRISRIAWLSVPATVYVEVFRNTPLLIQLYLYYRGLQSIGILLSPEACGVLALALYTGAYITEVFRSGILAVPKEQLETGVAMGLSRFSVYRLILVPQAVQIILPPLGNQLISLMKNSSLLAFITVSELFLVIYKGSVDAFRPVEYVAIGAGLYMITSLSIAAAIHGLDRWLKRAEPPLNMKEPVAL
jgi:His/Glu/Gln/Arg/opine family amino acid ABC transporter permease subunit